VDCASKGTLASGMGVGAGVGFAGEAEACWPGAVPPLEIKARITSKTIRVIGCIELEERLKSAQHLLLEFIDTNRGVDFIDQGSVLTNVQLIAESPAAR
jgi:hypothetical protein